MRRPVTPILWLVLLLPAMLLGACSGSDDPSKDDEPSSASTCDGDDPNGKALLDCVGSSLAYVETTSSTGSGVLLDDGYVVTNAHVVDPYRAADLTFPDGTVLTDVPVVGIDAFADVAVLGPVEGVDAPALDLGTGTKLDRGVDVYLIGYPGEADDEPQPTISRGLLSRTRAAKEFDQTYLQTDASIGSGQSGGALVDERGNVVGISGLEFAEEFALALDGTDVQNAVDDIVAGHGDPYGSLPDPSTATSDHSFDLIDELDDGTLVVGAADDERTMEVVIGPVDGLALTIGTMDGEPLLLNQAAIDLAKLTDDTFDLTDLGLPIASPTAPGTYSVELPADVETVVKVGSVEGRPMHVSVHTSVPSAEAAHSPRTPIALGKSVESSFDYFETADLYTLDLQAGDAIDLSVRSPQGDMAVQVRAPGSALKDLKEFDDGGGGLYDSDAEGTYTAKVDGTYVFGVYSYDGVVTGYRFSVSKAE